MGKCCIRFKRVEDLPLEVIGEAIRRVPAKVFLERYVQTTGGMEKRTISKRKTAKKKVAKR